MAQTKAIYYRDKRGVEPVDRFIAGLPAKRAVRFPTRSQSARWRLSRGSLLPERAYERVSATTLKVEGNEKPCFVGDSVTRVMAPAG